MKALVSHKLRMRNGSPIALCGAHGKRTQNWTRVTCKACLKLKVIIKARDDRAA